MDKRYTVFVSSTFTDLSDARWAVAKGLMRLNLIPLGMEAFTASNLSQWEIIKKTIDLSDYYILILGNRYGSIDEESGISYTEKEYRYALEQDIPCLALLSQDIPVLPRDIETDEHRGKLAAFRQTASAGRMVDFWTNPDELTAKAGQAMYHALTESPRSGWVRNPQSSPEVAEELARLSSENAILRRTSGEDESGNLAEYLNDKEIQIGTEAVNLLDAFELVGGQMASGPFSRGDFDITVRELYSLNPHQNDLADRVSKIVRNFFELNLINYDLISTENRDKIQTNSILSNMIGPNRPIAYYNLTDGGRRLLKFIALRKLAHDNSSDVPNRTSNQ